MGFVGRLLMVVAYLFAVPAGCVGLLGMAGWLSTSTHRFGPWDPRYLLLFHGSDVAELGLFEPVRGSAQYSGQGRDGTAPSYADVSFRTAASPEQVLEHYGARCSAIGLAPEPVPPGKMASREKGEMALGCTREGSELGIGAKPTGGLTKVTIGGWQFD